MIQAQFPMFDLLDCRHDCHCFSSSPPLDNSFAVDGGTRTDCMWSMQIHRPGAGAANGQGMSCVAAVG
jgi:hypothetical protein